MDANRGESRRSSFSSQVQRLALWEIMVLIAGAAVGIWLYPPSEGEPGPFDMRPWVLTLIGLLGGLSLVGPPLLLAELCRRKRWRAGKVLWFSQGMASWLLWPPVVHCKLVHGDGRQSFSAVCFAYGTPLMALYVTSALLAGGWIGRRRRRARRRSWREAFGLMLATLWACTGFYMLSLLYKEDFGH